MKKTNYWAWMFWIYLIRAFGLPFHLSPVKLPENEAAKLRTAAVDNDILVIFNSGGWGDVPLERAADFTPILEGIRQTLTSLGYRVGVVPYFRTLPGIFGRMSGTREQLNSFKHTSRLLIRDLERLAEDFPQKSFILAGYSMGGGLTGRVLERISHHSNIYGIMVGTPGWLPTFNSANTLVLNNDNRDPVCSGDVNTIAVCVLNWPFNWLRARASGQKVPFALALHMPHHDYSWSSPQVGPPIVRFLEYHFRVRDRKDI